MKKLKVIKSFYDKKEDKYVYPHKQPTIDREDARAQELINAGVAEEYTEAPAAEDSAPAEEPEQEAPEQEAPAEEKPSKKGGKK